MIKLKKFFLLPSVEGKILKYTEKFLVYFFGKIPLYFPLNYAVHLKLLLKIKPLKKMQHRILLMAHMLMVVTFNPMMKFVLHKVQEMKTAWLVHQGMVASGASRGGGWD